MVHLLSEKNSIINHFIAELRNIEIQKDECALEEILNALEK